MNPHPGKVSTHVNAISLTIDIFIADMRFTAPTPIIEVVLACVVETGILNIEQISKDSAAATSAEKP